MASCEVVPMRSLHIVDWHCAILHSDSVQPIKSVCNARPSIMPNLPISCLAIAIGVAAIALALATAIGGDLAQAATLAEAAADDALLEKQALCLDFAQELQDGNIPTWEF